MRGSSWYLCGVLVQGGTASSHDLNGRLQGESLALHRDWLFVGILIVWMRLECLQGIFYGHRLHNALEILLRSYGPKQHGDLDTPPKLSKHWGQRSLDHHLQYYIRRRRSQEAAWQNARDLDIIDRWLYKYNRIRVEHVIPPCDWYNFEEHSSDKLISLSLCLSKPHHLPVAFPTLC